jgi:hypothetical protein
MACQELEKCELPGSEADLMTAPAHAVGRRVELEIADRDPRSAVVDPPSSKGANPGPELRHRERLRQVVVGAAVQAGYPVGNAVERREHEDRLVETAIAQGRTDGEAIKPRQDHIEDHELVRIGVGKLERDRAVGNDVDRVTVGSQAAPDRIGDGRLVLNNENAQILLLGRRKPIVDAGSE